MQELQVVIPNELKLINANYQISHKKITLIPIYTIKFLKSMTEINDIFRHLFRWSVCSLVTILESDQWIKFVVPFLLCQSLT
jgi:hypothetical protein